MKVKIRFFVGFRELLGNEIIAEPSDGTTLLGLIHEVAGKKKAGYDAIFDDKGNFREFVILMRNTKRTDTKDAANILVRDGDDIAVFPPVAGG